MNSFVTYPITPMGAPRITRADSWRSPPREVVSRYWAFKDLVKAHQMELCNGDGVVFVLPMPVSWSKKKKAQMCGQWCQSKPDLDNLLKALLDALFLDDAHIAELSKLRKEWGYTGEIRIYHG